MEQTQIHGSAENYFAKTGLFYITDALTSKSDVKSVFSDNYLSKGDLTISWKYIDYVYISYSAYTPNAMELCKYYFGSKIFTLMKTILTENVEAINNVATTS